MAQTGPARTLRSRMDFAHLIAALWELGNNFQGVSTEVAVDVHVLVRRAQVGDSEAVATLYQVFVQPIYRYIAFRMPSSADAEDLTAEVFLRMVEGLPKYVITDVPFEAWLYRIAAARVADYYRRAGRRTHSELSEDLTDYDPLPEERVVQQQTLELVRRALHQLSDEHQSILFLRFVERKSHEEVALILNKSMTAVKSAQHRALSQLASILGTEQKVRHYLRGSHG